jgi:hypothetical protein
MPIDFKKLLNQTPEEKLAAQKRREEEFANSVFAKSQKMITELYDCLSQNDISDTFEYKFIRDLNSLVNFRYLEPSEKQYKYIEKLYKKHIIDLKSDSTK